MTVHIEQRTSRLAGWSRFTAYFAAVLLLVAGAAHQRDKIPYRLPQPFVIRHHPGVGVEDTLSGG